MPGQRSTPKAADQRLGQDQARPPQAPEQGERRPAGSPPGRKRKPDRRSCFQASSTSQSGAGRELARARWNRITLNPRRATTTTEPAIQAASRTEVQSPVVDLEIPKQFTSEIPDP